MPIIFTFFYDQKKIIFTFFERCSILSSVLEVCLNCRNMSSSPTERLPLLCMKLVVSLKQSLANLLCLSLPGLNWGHSNVGCLHVYVRRIWNVVAHGTLGFFYFAFEIAFFLKKPKLHLIPIPHNTSIIYPIFHLSSKC